MHSLVETDNGLATKWNEEVMRFASYTGLGAQIGSGYIDKNGLEKCDRNFAKIKKARIMTALKP